MLQRMTTLVNKRGWWLQGILPLCGLVMVGRYDRGVRRTPKKYMGCGLCRIRMLLKDSTSFNSVESEGAK